jgi:hypothetical protein
MYNAEPAVAPLNPPKGVTVTVDGLATNDEMAPLMSPVIVLKDKPVGRVPVKANLVKTSKNPHEGLANNLFSPRTNDVT